MKIITRILLAACSAVLISISPAFPESFFLTESENGLLSLSNLAAVKDYKLSLPGRTRGFDNTRFIKDVKARLEGGCGINTLDSDGNNILMRLTHHVSHNFPDKTDITPAIDFLLKSGIDINQRNKYGQTVLFFARAKTIGYLIDHGADVTVSDNNGNTLLHGNENRSFLDPAVLKIAVQHININAANRAGSTPLIALLKDDESWHSQPDLDLLQWFLSHGASVSAADNSGFTALHYAAVVRSAGAVKLLLEHHAFVDACSAEDGTTALLLAVESDDAESSALLIAAGADIDRPNRSGLTPRIVSYAHGSKGVLSSGKGSDPSQYLNHDGPAFTFSPLDSTYRGNLRFRSLYEYLSFTACRNDNAPLLDALISHGASLDVRFASGETPLMIASANGSASAVRTLLSHHANRNLVDSEGLSAFWHALESKKTASLPEILRLLYDPLRVKAPIRKEELNLLTTVIETGGKEQIACVREIPLLSGYINALLIKDQNERDPAAGLKTSLEAGIPADIVAQVYTDFIPDISIPVSTDRKVFDFITRFGGFDIDDDETDTLFIPGSKNPSRKEIQAVYNRIDPFGKNPYRRGSNSFLTSAARCGGIPLIDVILDKGYPVDSIESWADYDTTYADRRGTALMHCSGMALAPVVEHLLLRGADARLKNDEARTALHFAAESGKTDTIVLLLAHGAEIDAQDSSGVTPLMLAAYHGHENCAQFLLTHGANIEKVDKGGWNALMWGCLSGRKSLVASLLRRGAKSDVRAKDGLSALVLAKLHGRNDIAMILLEKGALMKPADAVTLDRYRLLQAAATGNVRLITTLLAKGLSADTIDSTGRSAVFFAAANGHIEALRILLESGADPDLAEAKGTTPLMAAVNNATAFRVYKDGTLLRVIDLLIANGASLEKTDRQGNTALFYCTSHFEQNIGLMNTLAAYGADMSHENSSGLTMLHRLASQYYWDDSLRDLRLSMFTTIDPKTRKGVTPLMLAACCRENTLFLERLISCGASPEEKDAHGFRAIDYALAYRNYPAAAILADRTQNIPAAAMNAAGKYALHIHDDAKALDWYDKAAAADGGWKSFLGAGEAALKLGDAEHSRSYLSKGLGLSPKQPELLFMMACWHSLNGTPGDSVALLEKALLNGYRFPERILHHPDLDSARRLAEFKRIRDMISR